MKYAFCGAHGTGKSAAAHFTASKFKKQYPHKTIKVLEEAVRESAKLVGINNENFQKDWYVYIIKMFTFDALICNTDCYPC